MIALPEPGPEALVPRRRTLADYGLRGRLRLLRILWAGATLRASLWAHEKGWFTGGVTPTEVRRLEGARVRDELIRLGPTFIKIGQMLSTRIDLLPVEFTEELKELLDRVPPFPNNRAFAILEAELGRPLKELYAFIDAYPIAAASLGQAYAAIAAELRTRYSIGYYPTNAKRDGTWRKLSVELPGQPRAKIVTRPGYWAPKS